jgi:hypothetical protein
MASSAKDWQAFPKAHPYSGDEYPGYPLANTNAMRRILYTSDPYEPSGTIGVYSTEEERQAILSAYLEDVMKDTSLAKEWYLVYLTDEEFTLGVYHPIWDRQ